MATPTPLLLIFVLAFSPAAAAAATAKFDFLYLTLTWPGTTCGNTWPFPGCCCPTTGEPQHDFFVQDLVPVDSITGNSVSYCNSNDCSNFKINALKDVITDLFGYWSSVSCPSNNGMDQWKSIWCSYGSCSNLTEKDYFTKALALRAHLNLLYVLQDNGIVPSSSKLYELSEIENVLNANFAFSTMVDCTKRPIFFGESKISKIVACVSADGNFVIGCPIKKKSSCDKYVRFQPITSSMMGCSDDVGAKMVGGAEMASAMDAAM